MNTRLGVDTVASAPAIGGATVHATHNTGWRLFEVNCTAHGSLLALRYPHDATDVQVRIGRRTANRLCFAHATGCEARR